jgi:hypothetical protein
MIQAGTSGGGTIDASGASGALILNGNSLRAAGLNLAGNGAFTLK